MRFFVFQRKITTFVACFGRGTILIAQLSVESAPRKINEQCNIHIGVCAKRRLHHCGYMAVQSLTDRWRGCAFFFQRFAPFSQMKLEYLLTINNDKYEKLKIYISAHCAFKHGWNEGVSPRHRSGECRWRNHLLQLGE